MNITIERQTPFMFNTWTDGPKYVLDSYGVHIEVDPKVVTQISISGPTACNQMFADYFPAAGTFYYIGRIRDFLKIVEANPKRDLRFLVLNDE